MRKAVSKKRQRENAAQSQDKEDEKPDNAGTKFGRGAKTEKKDQS